MEKPVVFGDAENLFGIVNVPEENRNRTAVVMLTAGMLHHVGSFRFHVLLARELEKIGVSSFRFDLSGIGESLASGLAGDSLSRAAHEVGQAIDVLTSEYGIENVVLFGLCSGADDAWHVAKLDKRVIGLAMIDGLGYSTKNHQRFAWLDKARRLSKPSFWNAKLRRNWNEQPSEAIGLPFGTDIREFPSREVAAEDLRHFIDREMSILACYTGGAKDYYNYPEQFAEMFHDVALSFTVEHCFYPDMDHVALLKEDRQLLLNHFTAWIKKVALHTGYSTEKVASV
jgi:pimeloyl-ACP methyl ester carboxylesterase